MVLIGKAHFFSKRFGKFCFSPLLKNKLCVKVGRVGGGFFFRSRFGKRAGYPTKRAPDAGESGEIPSSFLRLIIFPVGRLRRPNPSAGNANRWAVRPQTTK